MRNRCTITDQRKYAKGEVVATLPYFNAVLAQFTRKDLSVLYHASRGFSFNSGNLDWFKEIQIHGQISFERDIDCVYVPKKDAEIEENKLAI